MVASSEAERKRQRKHEAGERNFYELRHYLELGKRCHYRKNEYRVAHEHPKYPRIAAGYCSCRLPCHDRLRGKVRSDEPHSKDKHLDDDVRHKGQYRTDKRAYARKMKRISGNADCADHNYPE